MHGYVDKVIRNIDIKLLLLHKTKISWSIFVKAFMNCGPKYEFGSNMDQQVRMHWLIEERQR